MSKALYLTSRPKTWEEVAGQEHVIQTLQNSVRAERTAHALLFAGPRGTGKTSTARILAKAVNCLAEDLTERPCNQCAHCIGVNNANFLDLIEIDAASNTSVDDIRDLRDKINFSPNQARFKVYIIDEVHMLSTAAFNALLKTLEEPPPHAVFILATTEIHKIPKTVLSRCQRHEFRRIPVVDIVKFLEDLAEKEDISIESDAMMLIARQATGSLRDAVSFLDQLASGSIAITLEKTRVVLGTATNQSVIDIVDAIVQHKFGEGLDRIYSTLDSGSDPYQFARQIVNYLRNLLLVKKGNADLLDATVEEREQISRHAQSFSIAGLLDVIRGFTRAANETRTSWLPALPLELAFIESIEDIQTEQERLEIADPVVGKKVIPPKAKELKAVQAVKKVSEPIPDTQEKPANPVPDSVIQSWKQILAVTRKHNPQTQALLNSCRPLGVKDGALVLAFNSEFTRNKMEQKNHIEITQQGLEEILGESMPIKCITATKTKGHLPEGVDADGLVATAIRDLGGKIVDIP